MGARRAVYIPLAHETTDRAIGPLLESRNTPGSCTRALVAREPSGGHRSHFGLKARLLERHCPQGL